MEPVVTYLINNRILLFKVCHSVSLSGFFIGLIWLSVFVAFDQWAMATAMLTLGLAIFPCWLVARGGYFAWGIMGAQLACIAFTVTYSIVFDAPSPYAPRTTHLFLLVIALAGYVNFQIDHSKFQLGILVTALLSFLTLCSISYALSVYSSPPMEFIIARAWINATLVTVLLSGSIGSMHSDFICITRDTVELRKALKSNQFELFFQPQVDADGGVLGAEALLRWKNPRRGYVSPAEFIPLAESAGLMPAIGSWVIYESCRVLRQWREHPSTKELTLSINITGEQFALPDFVKQLLTATVQQNIPPPSLKMELTESAFIGDIDNVVAKMEALQSAGFSLSLDDFGTGYSSLSYLRRLPLQQLKIDRSFVRGVDYNQRAAKIAKSIVQMGHDLSLEVLAEGVETEAELRVMQSYGCSIFQGFWFAEPLCLADFEHYAANNTIVFEVGRS